MSKTDAELLAAWRAGDKRAGHALCERHLDSLIGFFSHRIEGDSMDLIQQTFLGLVDGGIERFRGQASFRTLLFAIARNQLYTHLRNVNRARAHFEPDSPSLMALDTSPTNRLAATERRHHLIRALVELPLDDQIMFELHYWQNLQLREIAAIFDIPPGTLRQRLRRARRTIAARLVSMADEPDIELTLTRLSAWAMRVEAEAVERYPALEEDRSGP